MKKFAAVIFSLGCLMAGKVQAQSGSGLSASASQTIQLQIAPVIAIQFKAVNSSTGSMVNMNFDNVSKMANGVVAGGQELSIKSNKPFKISVQTDASSFAFSGNGQAPSMPVSNHLFMAVTSNATGGNIPSSFDNNFSSLGSNSQDVVLNGQQGGDQTVTVAYKAKPGMNYPAGNYTVGVVYTATQP